MKRISAFVALLSLSGCMSMCQLNRDVDAVKVEGETPLATYEVVNCSYRLFSCIPLTTGLTWKEGPYDPDHADTFAWFDNICSLDDNIASVRHACKVVGSDKVRNVTARYDKSLWWSFFIVEKRIVKTACVIVK